MQNRGIMSEVLRKRLKGMENKARIINRERMEQALLALIEYEQRIKLKEQNISLIEECVDIINRLSGIDKGHEVSRAKKAGQCLIDRIRTGDLDKMNDNELREVFSFKTDADGTEDTPDDEYLEELLNELHEEDTSEKYFCDLRQQYKAGNLVISNLTAEDILGLLHNEAVRIVGREPSNMQFVVDLLKRKKRFRKFVIPEEDKKALEKIFVGTALPYKRNSAEGKMIQKFLGVRRSRITKVQERELREFFEISLDEEEKLSWFGRFKIQRHRQYRLAQVTSVLILVLATVQLASCTIFEGNFFISVADWTKRMFVSLGGSKINEDENETLFSNHKTYYSVKEFYEVESIELLIPKYMPNDLTVQKIIYSDIDDDENRKIRIFYSNEITLWIYLNRDLIFEEYGEVADIYTVYEKDHYIFNNIKQASWQHDSNKYILIGEFTKEDFAKIIDSLYQ